jgi:hypothetical protein
VLLVGSVAVLRLPGLADDASDLALLGVSQRAFPDWFVGLIGSAGMLPSTTLDSLVGGLPRFLAQLNRGVVPLVLNFAVTAVMSAATRPAGQRVAEPAAPAGAEDRFTRAPKAGRERVRER